MSSDYNWPKPYLLQCYERAVEEGCIRIVLRGQTPEAREAEWKSFKAAFYRLRRKKDANFAVQMRPEFQLVSIQFEPAIGKVLISYSSLPDGQLLPTFESVEDQTALPQQPPGAIPHETVESDPDVDFNADEHVSKLIGNLSIDEDDSDASDL
jgi:hypothetical protein